MGQVCGLCRSTGRKRLSSPVVRWYSLRQRSICLPLAAQPGGLKARREMLNLKYERIDELPRDQLIEL